jgi:hypothetical protein
MAQSGGSTSNRIYLDNQVILQMPVSEEHPEGEVRVLKQGWNEIPPELQDHPIIRRLKPESEGEGQRRQQLLDAERKRTEAISKAEEEYSRELNEAEKSRREELQQRSEERAKRVQEAQERGEVSYEPNPDPDAAHAEALTLEPGMQVVSAAGMAYKGDESVAAGQRRVMESGIAQNQGGQPNQGGSGYARQQQAHRTTAPVVDEEGNPQGTNKDEMTGVNTSGSGGGTSGSGSSGTGTNTTGSSTTTSSSSSTTPPPSRTRG